MNVYIPMHIIFFRCYFFASASMFLFEDTLSQMVFLDCPSFCFSCQFQLSRKLDSTRRDESNKLGYMMTMMSSILRYRLKLTIYPVHVLCWKVSSPSLFHVMTNREPIDSIAFLEKRWKRSMQAMLWWEKMSSLTDYTSIFNSC